MSGLNSRCPNCSERLTIQDLSCESCGLKLHGRVQLPRLARLDPEDQEFIETFILASGSLKEAGRMLGISYPTVRSRLDRTMEKLRALYAEGEQKRLSILEMLEQGKITARDAIELLKHGEAETAEGE